MYYGGDYNPEQWPESVWAEDARLMRQARVNLVSLGVFAWARIEPEEGRFEFAWLDRVLDLLHDHEIGVNLATATASPPPWVSARYPDILPVTADGAALGPGSRQHYAATSPQYRRLAAELTRRIGNRYARHPAVRMWHVNNEYACHVHADYSAHAAQAFRTWLERRYGDVDHLNQAWGSHVWSQHYTRFDDVEPPRTSPTSPNPSAVLDFRRFTSDSLLELYRMERDILRAAGAIQPITTNFMGAFPALNYWDWAAEVDIVADDSYPDPRDPNAFRDGALVRDLMRSLKPGRPWILMEQATDSVPWRPSNARKAPGQMSAWSEQAVARGAMGVMFFQWRQSRSGAEKFHSAMLPHSGTRSRIWGEVTALGAALENRAPAAPPAGDVAIVFDWENWWALTQPDLPADIDYLREVNRWYRALHARHLQTSFVRASDDLDGFRLVIAPALYLLTEQGAESLRRFVHAGGVLLSTPFTDIVDEHDRLRDGGYGVQLADVLGGRPMDFAGVLPEDNLRLTAPPHDFAACSLLEDFAVESAEIVLTTNRNEPALVRNIYGAGASLHLTVFLDDQATAWVLNLAGGLAGVEPTYPDLPATVEAIETVHGVTLINQSPEPTGELGPFEVAHIARLQGKP